MSATLFLEPRLAFLLLSALVIAAAIPIALAWAQVLPEERPPFQSHRSSPVEKSDPSGAQEPAILRRDALVTVLLLCVSLSFLWQLPGLPREAILSRAAAYIPEPWLQGLEMFGGGFLVVIPGVAAAYSILRPNPLRYPLIAAGILIPLLWLLRPWLQAALVAS